MHFRKGTTIVEFLVYFALFSFIVACSMSWIVGCHQLWNNYYFKRALLIDQCTAFDMLARDLQSAPSASNEWYVFLPHEIIWHTKNDDIGWHFKDKNLYRYQGTYSCPKKVWIKKNSTIVAKPIDSFSFSSPQAGNKQIITISITNAKRVDYLTICLKKGRLLPWKRKKEGQRSY